MLCNTRRGARRHITAPVVVHVVVVALLFTAKLSTCACSKHLDIVVCWLRYTARRQHLFVTIGNTARVSTAALQQYPTNAAILNTHTHAQHAPFQQASGPQTRVQLTADGVQNLLQQDFVHGGHAPQWGRWKRRHRRSTTHKWTTADSISSLISKDASADMICAGYGSNWIPMLTPRPSQTEFIHYSVQEWSGVIKTQRQSCKKENSDSDGKRQLFRCIRGEEGRVSQFKAMMIKIRTFFHLAGYQCRRCRTRWISWIARSGGERLASMPTWSRWPAGTAANTTSTDAIDSSIRWARD